MLQLENCRHRQHRLLGEAERRKLDFAILTNPKTVYYFTGAPVDPSKPQVFILSTSGKSLLITNQEPSQAAVEKVGLYTGYTIERVFNHATMAAEAAALARGFISARPGTAGVEYEFMSLALAQALDGKKTVDLSPVLNEMRRIKDTDEIECIRAAIRMTEAAYGAVKARLEPGMTERQVHNVVYEAMSAFAGTSVHLMGDFVCGERAVGGGGPATERKILLGDLFILDLFPVYHAYMCDLTRTFIAGSPSQLQLEAWAHVRDAHTVVGKILRPGVRAKHVYEEVRAHLDRFVPLKGSFFHHAGHGVGMDGWEFPWLIPGSDQLVQEGEVIACEPALYGKAIQGGLRLERDYLVEKHGVTPLDSFPMDLR